MDGLEAEIDSQTLVDRGDWGTEKAVRVYRKPARYLRLLQETPREVLARAAYAPDQIVERLEALTRELVMRCPRKSRLHS